MWAARVRTAGAAYPRQIAWRRPSRRRTRSGSGRRRRWRWLLVEGSEAGAERGTFANRQQTRGKGCHHPSSQGRAVGRLGRLGGIPSGEVRKVIVLCGGRRGHGRGSRLASSGETHTCCSGRTRRGRRRGSSKKVKQTAADVTARPRGRDRRSCGGGTPTDRGSRRLRTRAGCVIKG